MSIRIVVVDDHDGMRKSLANYLRMVEDIEVIADTGDCFDALKICGTEQPDAVLVDVRMKQMSGTELTRRLREAGNEAAIIGLSMYRPEEMEELMLSAGADGYIDKMASPAELLSVLHEAVNKAHERKTGTTSNND